MGNVARVMGSSNKRVRNIWHKDSGGAWIRDRKLYYAAGDVNANFIEPTSGLVARYAFEGNLNDSIGGFNLTGSGSIGYGAGISGSAVQFITGSSTAYVNNSTLSGYFTGNKPYTVSMWVNVPCAVEIFKQSSGETNYSNPSIFINSTSVFFRRESGAYSKSDLYGAAISYNEWHHIAASYDGNTMRLYVDGVKTSLASTFSSAYSGTVWIKLIGSTYPSGFGLVDQVRIYSRCLTDDEILILLSERGLWKRVNI